MTDRLNVKRWNWRDGEYYSEVMGESTDGDYVLYADHAAEVARLEAERKQWARMYAACNEREVSLLARVAELAGLSSRVLPCPRCEIGEDTACTCKEMLVPQSWLVEATAERDSLRGQLEEAKANHAKWQELWDGACRDGHMTIYFKGERCPLCTQIASKLPPDTLTPAPKEAK